MKTLKIFAVLCFFVVLPTTKAISQATTGSYDWNFTFSAGDCLDEDVSGTITVQQLWNNNHYQEKGKGTLTGSISGDEYTLIFEYNGSGHWGNNMVTGGFSFPMKLFHENKLVLIIHESYRGVILTENYFGGPHIVDRYVYSVECK
jgi:hypothetical protein